MKTVHFIVLIQTLLSVVISQTRNKITNLPGQPSVEFEQYSGYVVLNKTTQKSVFYWFQLSQNNPFLDPIVLWTNGGGERGKLQPPKKGECCSGLIGALTENGAFRIQSNGTLIINNGSWNKIANMLYIEQPVPVGYSYTNNNNDIYSTEYKLNDFY